MITNLPLLLLPGCTRRFAALLCLLGTMGQVPSAPAAPAASISELMELGVYSEETKGDIDAAMQLYQQVVAEAKTNQSLAAQALFRLAICHDKKNDVAAATAAFERLIREYPAEKDLVAAASDYLADGAALLPAPWQDGEDLVLDIKLPSGVKMGVARYSTDAGQRDGRKTWRFTSLIVGQMLSSSRTEVEAGSMKPLHATWTVRPMADTETTYANGRAELKAKGLEPRTVELNGLVYDNEEAIHLIRRLPLAVGFKKTLNVFVAVAAGQIVPVQLEVVGTESLQVAAGTFECYKVTLNLIGQVQTFWFSTGPDRVLAKFEAGGVFAELKSIKKGGPDLPISLREPNLGYTVNAPAGWLVEPSDTPEQFKRPTVNVLDEAGTAMTTVMAEAQKNFDPAAVATVRAYADHQIAAAKKFSQSFDVRADSWHDTTVDGQPALACIADQVKGPVKLVTYNTYTLIGEIAVSITSYVPPEEAESFQPKHEAIVAGFRGK